MTKRRLDKNYLPLVLSIFGILALAIFLIFPVTFIDNGVNYGGINGWISTFGGSVSIPGVVLQGATKNLTFRPVNGMGLTIIIMMIISSVCSGWMERYGKGFFIFSLIVDVVAVIFICTYHTSWIRLNIGGSTITGGDFNCGAGQVIAAVLLILQGIGNIVAFRLKKK